MLFNSLVSKSLTWFGTAHLNRRLRSSDNATIGAGLLSKGIPMVRVHRQSTVVIGNNFKINNGERFNSIGRQTKCVFIVRKNAQLQIGNNVGISSSTIFCSRKVVIGDNVKIGGNTCIYDTDFHSLDYVQRRDRTLDVENTISREVIIGSDVFIGAHSTILKGVTIGDRSIIGAGSVVTKSIPAGEIWGGNPAVFIRKVEDLKTVLRKAI